MENTQNIVILAQGDQVYCEKAVYTATKKGLELTELLDNKDGQNKIFANRKADGKSILPLAGNERSVTQAKGIYLYKLIHQLPIRMFWYGMMVYKLPLMKDAPKKIL